METTKRLAEAIPVFDGSKNLYTANEIVGLKSKVSDQPLSLARPTDKTLKLPLLKYSKCMYRNVKNL